MKNSIRQQLYLLGAMLGFSLILAFGYSLYALYHLKSTASEYISENSELSLTIGRINGFDRQQETILQDIFEITLTPPKQTVSETRLNLEQEKFQYYSQQLQKEYKRLILIATKELNKANPPKVNLSYSVLLDAARQTQSSYRIYTDLMENVFNLLKTGNYRTAKNIFDDVERGDDRISRLVEKLETTRRAIIDSSRGEALEIESSAWALSFITLGSLIVLFVSIFFIVRNVMVPLSEAIRRTQYVATGGRQQQPNMRLPLEFGVLFNAINVMLDAIKKAEENHITKAEQLQKTNEELEVFASAMAHDLKNPLNVIMGYSELLESKPSIGKEERRWLRYTRSAVDDMLELIDGLLKYARLGQATAMETSEVDLSEIVEDVLLSLQPIILQNKVSVQVDHLPTLPANRLLIRQVFQNLVSNAIKYHGDEDPKISITAQELSSHWQVSVADNGIGVEASYRDKIFEIFNRGSSSTKASGSGVGLASVKKIIEKHAGKIWVEPASNQGSIFRFTLPKERTSPVYAPDSPLVTARRPSGELI